MIDIYKRVRYSLAIDDIYGWVICVLEGREANKKVHFYREVSTCKEQMVQPRFASSGCVSIKGILVIDEGMLRNCIGKLVNIIDTRRTLCGRQRRQEFLNILKRCAKAK